MKIDILTLFPEMFEALNQSILGRAQKNNLVEINLINIRDFSKDKFKKCDDYTYGGGAGMLMTPQPIYDAIMSVKKDNSHVIYLSPKGRLLKQNIVIELAKNYDHLILLCGHLKVLTKELSTYLLTKRCQLEIMF